MTYPRTNRKMAGVCESAFVLPTNDVISTKTFLWTGKVILKHKVPGNDNIVL